MTPLGQAFTLAIAISAIVVVLLLIRARRLKERYAFIWLALSLGMLVLVLVRPLLDRVTGLLGIQSGTTTLFVLSTLAMLAVVLHLSISLSTLEEKLQEMAEALALANPLEPIQQIEEE